MLNLALPEMILFSCVLVIYLAASIVGLRMIYVKGDRFKPLLIQLIAIGVVLEAVILIFRAVEIKAIPLTGSFESMIVLTIVFGLIYFLFGMVIHQPWFSAVISWVLLIMILITAVVASPAAKPSDAIATPWALAHGLAMILGEVMILLAAVSAFIYLIANHRLKQKKITKLIGIVPNLQMLQNTNSYCSLAAFVFVSLGILSGIGMAYMKSTVLEISLVEWFRDLKVISMAIAWLLVLLVVVAQQRNLLHRKTRAYLTLAAFLLILFAMIGVITLFSTKHDFKSTKSSSPPTSSITQNEFICHRA